MTLTQRMLAYDLTPRDWKRNRRTQTLTHKTGLTISELLLTERRRAELKAKLAPFFTE